MRAAFLVLVMAVSTPLQAQQMSLDARTAQAIVAGCAAHATAKKQSHAIAVVDVGGHLVAALRMDGNGSGIMDFSMAKAEAVAAWGFPTAQMEQAAREFGIDLWEHVGNVIIAMRRIAPELGLVGNIQPH